MPHDKNGHRLAVGDEVVIRCRVVSIAEGSDGYCNTNVETDEPMYPETHKTNLWLNCRQVERISQPAGFELGKTETESPSVEERYRAVQEALLGRTNTGVLVDESGLRNK